MTTPFERFDLERPTQVGIAHADAIEVEADRLARALDDGDDAQALGYLKCLVEAVAKVVLDLNGEPAPGNATFDTVVNKAHSLLADQEGAGLIHDSPFSNFATQARKMAVSMSSIRNSFGAGHGRARQPEVMPEMLKLALDGSLLWTRWALRRLDAFAQGRPETLIRDLVGDPYGQIIFTSGSPRITFGRRRPSNLRAAPRSRDRRRRRPARRTRDVRCSHRRSRRADWGS